MPSDLGQLIQRMKRSRPETKSVKKPKLESIEIQKRNEIPETNQDASSESSRSSSEMDSKASLDYFEDRYNQAKIPSEWADQMASVDAGSHSLSNSEETLGGIVHRVSAHALPGCTESPLHSISQLSIKERLADVMPELNSLQTSLFQRIHSYHDLLFTSETISNFKEIKTVYALHALNHIYKSRDRTLKNSTKIKLALNDNQTPP